MAHDGFEAIQQAQKLKPDVVVMDIQMPRCDGLTATRLIKSRMPGTKIVMLTMVETDETLFQAMKSGASGYLLKDLDGEEFVEGCWHLSAEKHLSHPLSHPSSLRNSQKLSRRLQQLQLIGG